MPRKPSSAGKPKRSKTGETSRFSKNSSRTTSSISRNNGDILKSRRALRRLGKMKHILGHIFGTELPILRKARRNLGMTPLGSPMKMDVLRCETVEGVLKELAVFCLAYNLVRSVMVESARLQGVAPERVSLVD